jgi:hypothetical protein
MSFRVVGALRTLEATYILKNNVGPTPLPNHKTHIILDIQVYFIGWRLYDDLICH